MTKRKICNNCQRPASTCLCAELVLLHSHYQIIVLQDKTEAKHALSSTPLLIKQLHNSQLYIGDTFVAEEILGQNWQDNSVLVFPDSVCSEDYQARTIDNNNIKHIILLDGTWKKVRRLIHLNPWLNQLARISIDAASAGNYRIRKSEFKHGLATIEAASNVLNQLSESSKYSALLCAFDKMITQQIELMGEETFNKNY